MRYEGNVIRKNQQLGLGDVLILGDGSIRYICSNHKYFYAMSGGIVALTRDSLQELYDFYNHEDSGFEGIAKHIKKDNLVIKEVR